MVGVHVSSKQEIGVCVCVFIPHAYLMPGRSEEGIKSPELELQKIVSCHVN